MSCKKGKIKVKNKILLQYVNMDFINEYDSYLQLVI